MTLAEETGSRLKTSKIKVPKRQLLVDRRELLTLAFPGAGLLSSRGISFQKSLKCFTIPEAEAEAAMAGRHFLSLNIVVLILEHRYLNIVVLLLRKSYLALIGAKNVPFNELPICVRCSTCYFQSLQPLSKVLLSLHYIYDKNEAQ